MANPMTSDDFKKIAMQTLNQVFNEVYDEHLVTGIYEIEVDFDGQDEPKRINTRTTATKND